MIKVLLICGSSGSGKSYIERLLKESNFRESPYIYFNKIEQVTTRPPRNQEEIDNKVYRFIDEERYNKIKNNLIAKNHFNGYYYGSLNTIMEYEDENHPIINTIIVDREGWNNVTRDLSEIYGNDVDIFTLRITCKLDDLEERETRTKEFVKKEDKLLKSITDATLDNSKDNRLSTNDVIKCLIENKFISILN